MNNLNKLFSCFKNSNKNIIIGKNNIISPKAIIHNNVTIGDNNYIEDDVVIYPNCKIGSNNKIHNSVKIYSNAEIGNDNTFFPRNIIGEHPISSNDSHQIYEKTPLFKGVIIGNNNFFHVNNIVFSGLDNITTIGDHNKFLAENSIAHDVIIKNHVTFYHRVITGGYSVYLDYSNIGMGAVINQRNIVGQYSMIASNNTISKPVFPYFININNKIHRINKLKTSTEIDEYESILKEINDNFLNKDYNLDKYELPKNIHEELKIFSNFILNSKT